MKRAFTFAVVIVLAATGCKKKEEPKKNTNTSTSTTTTGGSTTGGTTTGGTTTGGSTTGGPGTPTNATTFHGALTAMETVSAFLGTSITIGTGQAWFSPSSTATLTAAGGITVTSLHLNGTELEPDSLGMYHSSNFIDVSSVTWSVTGNTTIPTFTLADTQGRPTPINPAVLPSTITAGAALNINLGNLSNFKIGTFVLTDGTGNLGGLRLVTLTPGANNLSFTAQDLAGFAPSQQGAIFIQLENFQVVNINGKNFRLSRQMDVYHSITVK